MPKIKDIKIENSSGTYNVTDIGAEVQNIDVSRDSQGEIITDITQTSPVTVESLAQTIKTIEEDIQDASSNFVGTTAEWEALSDAEKAKYTTYDLTDDFNGASIDDELDINSTGVLQNNVITKALGTPEEVSGSASKAYTQGQYLLGTDGNIYEVISNIAIGDTLVINTNIVLQNNTGVVNKLNDLEDEVSTLKDALYYNTSRRSSVGIFSGSCLQHGQAVRCGNVVMVTFILKFQGLTTNTKHTFATGLPKPVLLMNVSMGNEYGSSGTAIAQIDLDGSLNAKCNVADNFYYGSLVYCTVDAWS